jgi:hypothetical protein
VDHFVRGRSTEEENVDDLDRLTALEEIRKLKAMYWFAMDTKDFATLRRIFTADAIFDLRADRAYALGRDVDELPPVDRAIAEGDEAVFVGSAAIGDFLESVLQGWTTVQHGHDPILEITGADSASGTWRLFDYIDDGTRALKGYGHYHDEYRRVDGRWMISRSVLLRTRVDGDHPWSRSSAAEPSGE